MSSTQRASDSATPTMRTLLKAEDVAQMTGMGVDWIYAQALGLLHSIFDYAIKRGWASANPCKLVDKPRRADADGDVHFLEQAEIDALLAATPEDDLGGVERAMYLAAVMTGMRQGELLALRWEDVDWTARRVRVRRNFVRGEYGTPKSKRSTRSIPLADRLAGELHAHWTRTEYAADEDLVFAHPHTGKPMDRSSLLKRFKRALRPVASARSGFTTCATRSARAAPPPASRCARCRSGWATATSRRR